MEMLPELCLRADRYGKIRIMCELLEAITQFSNYFQDYYSPRLTLCQQFRLFYHLGKVNFGEMHTVAKVFLYILSTRKIQGFPDLLT